MFAALAMRVTQLQVLSGDHYEAMALRQRLRTIPLNAERGSIFDRNGRDLAISIERNSVYADPTLVADPALVASKLAPVVGVDQQTLYERLSDKSHRFVYIARTVDDATEQKVRDLGLAGVAFVPESQRQYPAGSVASTIIGRVGGEGFGLDGLEAYYDDELKGTPGEVVVERDQRGRDIPDTERKRIAARSGTDLVLTHRPGPAVPSGAVTRRPGHRDRGQGRHGGDRRRADRRRARDGDRRREQAAASRPTPRAGEATNRPLTDLFEPGSTNKLITIGSAIEQGKVGAHTEFDVPASIRVGSEKTYSDSHRQNGTDRWSTTDILRESSNVGTIMIAQNLGKDALAQALRDFGFGEKTAIDFPGQPKGLLLEPDEYYDDRARVERDRLRHRGHRDAVGRTCTRRSRIGGVSLPPRLVDATIDEHGERQAGRDRAPARASSPTKTAQTMTTMLGEVVRNGTGACAAIPGYTVAGKTGNVTQGGPEGGYSDADEGVVRRVRAGREPAARGASWSSTSRATSSVRCAAAPVFSEIVQSALNAVPRGADRCRRPAAVRRGARPRRRRGQQLHRPARRRAPGAPRPAGRSRRGRRQDRRGRAGPTVVDRSGIGPDRYLADDTSPSD